MFIIRNSIIPFKGYKAVNICGVLFARKGVLLSTVDINHEAIHTEQIKECLVIGFYIVYVLNWLVNGFRVGFGNAYRNILFEKEAYAHQYDIDYTNTRKHFAWIRTE